MDAYYDKVRELINTLDYKVVEENELESLFVVENQDEGVVNLLIDCSDPILVVEQHIFEIKKDDAAMYKELLMMNRQLVHGAFVIDDSGKHLMFRDTLQLENLDLNELEASINALKMMLSEFGEELISFARNN